jgi:hypothetical protein
LFDLQSGNSTNNNKNKNISSYLPMTTDGTHLKKEISTNNIISVVLSIFITINVPSHTRRAHTHTPTHTTTTPNTSIPADTYRRSRKKSHYMCGH